MSTREVIRWDEEGRGLTFSERVYLMRCRTVIERRIMRRTQICYGVYACVVVAS